MEGTVMPDGRTLYHHPAGTCKGNYCSLHRPSDHKYRDYPLDWYEPWGVMVRYVPVEMGAMVIDPDEYKLQTLRRGQTIILENAAKCLKCGDRIVSTYRHDFVSCSCHNLSVDGGHDYLKRGYASDEWYDDSIVYPSET